MDQQPDNKDKELRELRRQVRDLRSEFSVYVEQFFMRDDRLTLFAKVLLSEREGSPQPGAEILSPQALVETIKEASRLDDGDPGGISIAAWGAQICCFLYHLYDEFKQTSIAANTFFGGEYYEHLFFIPAQRGFVINVDGVTEIDGDYNFDIRPNNPITTYKGKRWSSMMHCEIEPCDQDRLKPFIDKLNQNKLSINQGSKQPLVILSGMVTYDPAHPLLGAPEPNLEVHPVTHAIYKGP